MYGPLFSTLSDDLSSRGVPSEQRQHTTRQVPVACPVCQGRTTVPMAFYDPPAQGTSAPTISSPVTCRSCYGRGVIFVTESVG